MSLYSKASGSAVETTQALFSGYWGSSHWGKAVGRKTDHCPRSNPELKNDWAIPPLRNLFPGVGKNSV